MEVRNTTADRPTFELLFASCLAAFSMFIVGYSAVRVYLAQTPISNTSVNSTVIPHEASLWSELGR